MIETPSTRLGSWKEIAAFLGKDVRTVMRWEKTRGLPVHRVPGEARSAVYAWPHEITAWLGKSTTLPTPPVPDNALDSPPAQPLPSPRPRLLRLPVRFTGFLTAALLLLLLATLGLRRFAFPAGITLTAETQLTSDGVPKLDLVSAANQVYFLEYRDAHMSLASVPADGGPIRIIPTPFVRMSLQDISPDGRNLLLLAWDGEEKERALWIVPTLGGSPVRIGSILCHSAVFTPDGRNIAYASGTALYFATAYGSAPALLHTFAETPRDLRWSFDGRRLIFLLRSLASPQSTLWQLALDNSTPPAVASLTPLRVPNLLDCCTQLTSLRGPQDSLILASTFPAQGKVKLLVRNPLPWQPDYRATDLLTNPAPIISSRMDRDASRLLVVQSSLAKYELTEFEPQSRAFRPFLPGVDGIHVDFSPDRQSIAYMRMPDQSLWVSKADGSLAHRISTPAVSEIELPRWSPDGKWIAFMAREPNRPWRILLVNPDGSHLHEASRTNDNQGAPTWSPDSAHLVYANLKCEEEGTCAVHDIDLASGNVTTIPGSAGLTTARSSPNGHFIAALHHQRHQISLWSRETGQWKTLTENINGDDLVWSRDSGSLYASRSPSGQPEIVRISLKDGKLETVVNFSDFKKLTGSLNSWFNFTPQGSILFTHILASDEIYAYNLKTD